MDIKTEAHYRYNDRYQGKHTLELFNGHYLSVESRRFKRRIKFRMELATLEPEPQKVVRYPWHWLAATLLSLAAAGALLYLIISGSPLIGLWSGLGSTVLLLLLGAGFVAAFRYGSERKWVFRTRAACFPLLNIPFDKAHSEEASDFVSRIQQAIEHNTDKKSYSNDDLFAGEMRMLRRLSRTGVISDATYDAAKKQMLGSGLQQSASSG